MKNRRVVWFPHPVAPTLTYPVLATRLYPRAFAMPRLLVYTSGEPSSSVDHLQDPAVQSFFTYIHASGRVLWRYIPIATRCWNFTVALTPELQIALLLCRPTSRGCGTARRVWRGSRMALEYIQGPVSKPLATQNNTRALLATCFSITHPPSPLGVCIRVTKKK